MSRRIASAAAEAEKIHASLLSSCVYRQRKHLQVTRALRPTRVLVERNTILDNRSVDDFRAGVRNVDAQITGIELEIPRPWPPYYSQVMW